MGSACHLKSAQSVVDVFRRKVQEHQLQDRVELKGSFCLGLCSEAVSAKVGETIIPGITVDNASDIFEKEVLPLVGRVAQ
jgi:NADH:ubiquinone oxidoreductase subunit E